MRKLKLTIEYDGEGFAGFQTQAAGIRTVQETLSAVVERMTGDRAVIEGAGRTDTGVHALGQVCHFRTESGLSAEQFGRGLNALLPRDMSVRSVEEVDDSFHARFSATRRTYVYLLLNRTSRSAVWGRYSLHESRALDRESMRAAARHMRGTRDFSSLANAGGDPGATMVRSVDRLQIRPVGGEMIAVVVAGNAFLRSMVRNIVGVLIDAGRGAVGAAEIERILEAKDRTKNPCPTVPPHGLCLLRVEYGTRSGLDAADALSQAGDEEG